MVRVALASMLAKASAVALTATALTLPALAQNYPQKTIRMIVAAAPGGANDILGRMYAQRMTEALGQTVVVDNRGGGGGVVGAEIVAHAAPDGYTLLYCTNSVVVNPSLNPKVNYSLKQFAPISHTDVAVNEVDRRFFGRLHIRLLHAG